MASHWHYPRAELTKLIIDSIQQDLLDRVSIFAPRKRSIFPPGRGLRRNG